jgi:hypothetical protein
MWSLVKIHQVGELVAAVAVVISLLFVGYEVQQNSEAQTRTATEAVVRDFVGSIRSLHADPEMVCIYSKGVRDFNSLEPSEKLRFSAYQMGVFYAIQEMHNAWRNNAIDLAIWSGFDRHAKDIFQLPGNQQWFANRRSWFSVHFQEYFDSYAIKSSSFEHLIYDDPACQSSN